MTNPTPTAPAPARATLRFLLHFLEMVAAMLAGMVLLGPLWDLAWPGLAAARTDVQVLVMATDMTVAMAAWMRVRGHAWRPTLEMSAAMYLPFLVLFPPFWAGAITPGFLMTGGHVLMLPAMAVAMLLRRREYTGCGDAR